jgi:hypothetical protein
MRRGFFSICSVLLILVASIAVLGTSCNGGATTGTIEVDATLDGLPWPSSGTGAVNYTLTGPAGTSPIDGTEVPKTFTGVDAGDWTCAYVCGGPGTFVDITPSDAQIVTAGGTIGFTLNFETPATPMDASVTFKNWTLNGMPIPPKQTWVYVLPGDWIDVEYEEHVSGEEDAVVSVHQTSWLEVHNIGWYGEEPQGPTIDLHVVNAPGAVKMDPPADKSNQQATVNGDPVDVCSNVPLPYCEKVKLDVEVDWELVVCNNYTKTINWIGFPAAEPMTLVLNGAEVLFDATGGLYDGVTFNLTAKACLEPGEGFEDTNPSNDCTDWSPTLTITYLISPP